MALKGMEVGLAMALVTLFLWSGAMAQSSSCTTALIGLSPCLNYITGNSSTPSTSCCTQLASVVQSQPLCLCLILNGDSSSLGITINQTKALELPSSCNVQTPPVSECNRTTTPAAGGPTTSAADSPLGAPTAGGGSRTTGGDSSDASSTLPLSFFFSLLFIASYATTLVSF